MKVINKYMFFLFFILLAPGVKSQNSFMDGYIITNSNDTVTGKIKDKSLGNILKKIRFKGDSGFTKKLNPYQIAGYKIGNTTYESVWIDVKNSFLRISYVGTPGSGQKHFMKVIVKGNLTLYGWEYLDDESDTIEEVPLFRRKNDNNYIRVTQGIFGLREKALKEYFADYPELCMEIENRKLKNPVDIANFYNKTID